MRTSNILGACAVVLGLCAAGGIQSAGATGVDSKKAGEKFRVEILGASVSRQWRVEEFGQRTGMTGVEVRARQEYDFDKTKLLRGLLAEPSRPDAVVIKECAAYFPGDGAKYQRLVEGWVGELRSAGIRPVLATSTPVTQRMPLWIYAKQLIKRYVLRTAYTDNDKRLEELLAYNDWVRAYAVKQNIPLLDLEKAVRTSPADRALKPEFTSGDGLHLSAAAYREMDSELRHTLGMLVRR